MIAAPEIGLASVVDAQAIALLARDEIEHGLGWSWTPARVQRCIRDAHSNAIVARDGGRVIGFALMRYDADHAHLLLFGVAPAWRRQRVASALWAWLEATLRTAGIRSVQVELRASNHAARAFYERVGFEQVNATQRYYRGVETALHMVKELTAATP
ncbi:GNAT family N-acetyltransferase [Rudaea sp.]|uniref:GNAT family N-acetyltransferase n=1 Tax=Rudaea sp. TaxID=2136325 RepID=UPI0032206E5E